MVNLYPTIPTAPEIDNTREDYQYKRIMGIEQELRTEIKTYHSVLKKYKIMLKTTHIIMTICSIIT